MVYNTGIYDAFELLSRDRIIDLEIVIRSADRIFNLEIVIRSTDRIFDLEIELTSFNTFYLILKIKQVSPLGFGTLDMFQNIFQNKRIPNQRFAYSLLLCFTLRSV